MRWVACLATLLAADHAMAQSPVVSAEALFAEGRRLVNERNFEEACSKFAASQQLAPSSGTLLNLANCYEKLGRIATAWATYQEAASLASATGRSEHLETAQKYATALKPTLPRVVVSLSSPPANIEVKRDGVLVPQAEWGLAVPIDPGSHQYKASAPGYTSVTLSQYVPKPAEGFAPPLLRVQIPELVREEGGSPNDTDTEDTDSASETGWHHQKTAALLIGGVGLAGFGLTIGFTVSAVNKYNDTVPEECPVEPNKCTLQGVEMRESARVEGNVATGALIGGGAASVLAVILWLTAPSSTGSASTKPTLAVTPAGIELRGTW